MMTTNDKDLWVVIFHHRHRHQRRRLSLILRVASSSKNEEFHHAMRCLALSSLFFFFHPREWEFLVYTINIKCWAMMVNDGDLIYQRHKKNRENETKMQLGNKKKYFLGKYLCLDFISFSDFSPILISYSSNQREISYSRFDSTRLFYFPISKTR